MCQHSHYTGVRNPGFVTIRRNPPEKGDSVGNYQLIDEESTRGRGFHRELRAHLCRFRAVRSKFAENLSNSNNFRISSSKSFILTIPTQKNLNTTTFLKLKTNLIRPYKELYIYPIKSKKDSKFS
jgi:hypothetical protein